MPIHKLTNFEAQDHILDLAWSKNGTRLAVTPSQGLHLITDATGTLQTELPAHGLSNGIGSWSNSSYLTCGANGKIRLYDFSSPAKEIDFGKSWIEHAKWSPDLTHLAVGVGKTLQILDKQLQPCAAYSDHKSSVCDFVWNPQNAQEITSVCDGGAHMWRLGLANSYAHFDWGGASLLGHWSPDGRWLVTGDQTPSVHLYDFTRQHPLHIQGYESKVKSLSFNATSTRLATGGGPLVTVWDCTGREGPEGSIPKQLRAHGKENLTLDYHPEFDLLASGGQDGLLILFKPENRTTVAALEKLGSPVTCVRWNPAGTLLAAGTENGTVHFFAYEP